MAREIIIDKGRAFRVTAESFQSAVPGVYNMHFVLEGEVEDHSRRIELMSAMWYALERVFEDSGLARLFPNRAELHRLIGLGRRNARVYKNGRFVMDLNLQWDLRLGPQNSHPGCVFMQFACDRCFTSDVGSYTNGFYSKPFLPSNDSDPASVERQINDFVDRFKDILKRTLQRYIANNNDLWH